MTLILSVPAKDGIVMATDGQVTSGQVRWQDKKARMVNDKCLWSASGELALVQRVEELIQQIPNKNQPLQILRDVLSDIVKQAIATLLQKDFRTQFIQPPNPELLLALHPADFMFVEYRGSPRIMHLLTNGTAEWINKPFASGSGALFAYALIQRYQDHVNNMDLDKASLLAFKIVEESIQVGSWGLGYPIDIWQINKDGIKNLGEDEMAALRDTSRVLRNTELTSFLGGD